MQYTRLLQDFRRRWENSHNGVHRWVGATMARSWASSDPVFYMHHAFIDYQWEKFREQQLHICNVDPTTDYPPTDNEDHHPDESMDGMSYLDNIEGIAAYWTQNWFDYADRPSCANNCTDSPDMFCDEELGLCVSEIAFDVSSSSRRKRAADNKAYRLQPVKGVCEKDPYAARCQSPRKPETVKQIVDAVMQKEIPMPETAETVEKYMQRRIEKAENFPPESEEVFFRSSPDEENDPRTRESSVYELSKSMVKGKKLSMKPPSKDALRLNKMAQV